MRCVVAYQRVSTAKQDIQRQTSQKQRAHESYPDHEVEVIEDDGVSAFKVSIFDRPGGRRLCQMIEAGKVEAIFTDAQDRLSRGDDVEWVSFRALCESQGVRLIIDGREQSNDLGGRLEGYLKAVLARQESLEKSHRVRGGMRERAKRGMPNGGPPPYGYKWSGGMPGERRWEIAVHEAAVVERIFTAFAGGTSQKQIVRDLIGEGVPARRTAWHQGTISRILRSPVYLGRIVYNGEVIESDHPAILDEELWRRVEEIREAMARTKGGGRGRPSAGTHLFTRGVLRCGECGSAMVPRTIKARSKNGRPYEAYFCLGRQRDPNLCSQKPVRRELVDEGVESHLLNVGVDIEATTAHVASQIARELADAESLLDHAEREHATATARFQRVRRDYQDRLIDHTDWNEQRIELLAEQEAAAANVARLRARRDEIAADANLRDAEETTLRWLASVREAIVGEVGAAAGIEPLRAVLLRLFSHFTLHRIESENLPEHPALYSELLLVGGFIVEPHVRPEVVEGYECEGVVPILRREPLYLAENKYVVARAT